ncbi:hypothetical protein [Agromyces humi]|uniref:hypothetical protein n=1 Tax=Agromyces humi TaxID=1766800 RepID=UPI00135ACEF8|nr:hypothetical protein [Agromyces humi]
MPDYTIEYSNTEDEAATPLKAVRAHVRYLATGGAEGSSYTVTDDATGERWEVDALTGEVDELPPLPKQETPEQVVARVIDTLTLLHADSTPAEVLQAALTTDVLIRALNTTPGGSTVKEPR